MDSLLAYRDNILVYIYIYQSIGVSIDNKLLLFFFFLKKKQEDYYQWRIKTLSSRD